MPSQQARLTAQLVQGMEQVAAWWGGERRACGCVEEGGASTLVRPPVWGTHCCRFSSQPCSRAQCLLPWSHSRLCKSRIWLCECMPRRSLQQRGRGAWGWRGVSARPHAAARAGMPPPHLRAGVPGTCASIHCGEGGAGEEGWVEQGRRVGGPVSEGRRAARLSPPALAPRTHTDT